MLTGSNLFISWQLAVGKRSWQLAVGKYVGSCSWQVKRETYFIKYLVGRLKKVSNMYESFRELNVYKKAFSFAMSIFEVTKGFPP